MLNFHRATGIHLVAKEDEAYRYWIRTVGACQLAERAYGPHVVHRTRYGDLTDSPESTMRSLLEFLGEPYTAKCLEPLSQRINSSNVPADFTSGDPPTNPVIIEEALRLSRALQHSPQPAEASADAAAEMEAVFAKRVQYMATLIGNIDGLSRPLKMKRTETAESLFHWTYRSLPRNDQQQMTSSLPELAIATEQTLEIKLAHRPKSFWYPYSTLHNVAVLEKLSDTAGLRLLACRVCMERSQTSEPPTEISRFS
jgi:hypothetical protein